ncbi:MAG: fatty acid oxidation complex subunit alpha FadJ, partial [Actinobacteria bacterium]|nr:fatty acid oxidation complex subunit alpha FadJ [Actinomycetota bacterium]NIS33113.1 fatty acid oxidation complex subunit alpha FadJ [Actinomycetota bacterium]NIT96646.1 fatty acid oxidation complex subunit alpha FadJ [Actinomycetota bacterium]NIU20336.1 fatty acid oxidation complex subunit alpha FadJ [Actinomycetota bacterium]NIU68036.1 fatty acid oxidation complex subunit alpha FadJ [Actinomycetota bacterium]
RLMGLLSGSSTWEGFEDTDLFVEAVFEDLDLKRSILSHVEEFAPDAIFASNTSSLPIGAIAARAARPEQVVGMHYFSPVERMPLLEVIVTDRTDD